MPLLPFGETFHSSVSSKFLNFSVVMMSAAGRTRVSAPSLTPHPDGIVSIFHPRQPAVLWPSNKRRHPAARSSGVSVLSRIAALPEGAVADSTAAGDRVDRAAVVHAATSTPRPPTQEIRRGSVRFLTSLPRVVR